MRFLLLCGGILSSLPSVAAQSTASAKMTSGDSATLVRLEQQIEDAIRHRDLVFLDRAYAPGFRVKHSEGFLQSRSSWLTSARTVRYRARRVDSLDVEVHGDVALVTGRLYVLPESSDPKFAGVTVRYVRLYRRGAAGWQQLTHHSTKQTFGPPSDPD